MLAGKNKTDQPILTIKNSNIIRVSIFIDVALLIYVAMHFGWMTFSSPNLNTPAASVIQIILLSSHIGELVLVAGLLIFVTLGVIRTIRTAPLPHLLWRIVGSVHFVMTISLIGLLWILETYKIINHLHGYWPDRLIILEYFALVPRGDLRELLPGINQYQSGSNGKFIFSLLAFLYLSEKYLFELWGYRRVVALLPILALSILVIIGIVGEVKQSAYVNKQQWNVIGSENSWPDSVAVCQKLGDGWRLPYRSELALFLAKGEQASKNSKLAWTSTLVNDGASAVVVQTSPLRSGTKRDKDIVYDHNPCVVGGSMRLTKHVSGWSVFSEILSLACSRAYAPTLYPSKVEFIAAPAGMVRVVKGDQEEAVHAPYAETICIKPASLLFIPPILGSKYSNELNFETQNALDAFLRDQCQSGKLTSNPNTCTNYKKSYL